MYKITKSSSGIDLVPLESSHLEKRRVFIEGEITQESAQDFFKQILALNEESDEPIDVFINSKGGDVPAGLFIYDSLVASKSPVRTFCISEAYSMAALIFSAGDERFLFPNARLMLHQPLLGKPIMGNVSSVHSLYLTMESFYKNLNGILAENAGKTIDEIEKITVNDCYFSAKEACDFGLADAILSDFSQIMKGD